MHYAKNQVLTQEPAQSSLLALCLHPLKPTCYFSFVSFLFEQVHFLGVLVRGLKITYIFGAIAESEMLYTIF